MSNLFSSFYFQFAYFKRILEREKKRRLVESDSEDGEEEEKDDEAGGDQNMDDVDDDNEKEEKEPKPKKRETKRAKPDVESGEARTGEARTGEARTGDSGYGATARSEAAAITKDQLAKFQSVLCTVFEECHVQQVPMDMVREKTLPKTQLNEAQMMACIEQMSNENKVMLASDILYLI